MLSFASQLPEAHEYVVASWGQSNQNPNGLVTEAVATAVHLLQTNGRDLTITAISGDTVTVSTVLVANELVGAELRLMQPYYGQSAFPLRVGKASIVSNTTSVLTVVWDVAAPTLPATSFGVGFDGAGGPSRVAATAHGLAEWDRVQFSGSPLPPEITAGVTYFVKNAGADVFNLSLTLGGTGLTFTSTGAGATATLIGGVGAYAYWPDGRGSSYGNVRVLTPYLPEAPGAYPAGAPSVPNRAFPSSIAGYELAALFLDFTFMEGVDGYGASNSGGTVTYAADRVTDSSLNLATNILKGGYVEVRGQIRQIASNTATAILLTVNWAATPSNGTEFEAWVPHYRDNLHSRTVGQGFRYPSNFHQPGKLGTGYTYSRPRGRLVPSYVTVSGSGITAAPVYKLGPMFELGWRLSSRIGRRVNIVHLCADASGLTRSILRGGSPALLGWWSNDIHLDWVIDAPNSLATRLRNLLVTSAPAALVAESSAKTLRFLGEVAYQGETETTTTGRFIYGKLLATIHSWLRTIIHGTGLSYYRSAEDLPVVHAGFGPAWKATDTANGGYVLTAIRDWTALDPAAETIDISTFTTGADPGHFNGLGEYNCGALAADTLAGLVDEYVYQTTDVTSIEIANIALTMFGEKAKVFSLDPAVDQSVQAAECARLLPLALESVLESHAWAFATRTADLVAVTKDANRTDWAYAYALPVNLAQPLEVLPPGATSSGSSLDPVPIWRAPIVEIGVFNRTGHPFSVERNANRQLVLYTNVAEAKLRFVVKISARVQVPAKFKLAVARKLAALLVGSLVKGERSMEQMRGFEGLARMEMGDAAAADANRQQNNPPPQPMPWER